MIGQDIISRARIVLNDADAVRWTDAEFVHWINDGCRVIALLRPDSCVVNGPITLALGTKQSIAGLTPAGLRLLDVVRNITTSRGVRIVDREVLDTQVPGWHGASATQAVTNYIFDNRDPTTFYVYPPSTAGTQLEIIYARNPVVITVGTLGTDTLSPPDIYLDPLLNYVLARAYGKDATFAQNKVLADGYNAAFLALLGVKTQADARFSPDLNSPGAMPSAATKAGGV